MPRFSQELFDLIIDEVAAEDNREDWLWSGEASRRLLLTRIAPLSFARRDKEREGGSGSTLTVPDPTLTTTMMISSPPSPKTIYH